MLSAVKRFLIGRPLKSGQLGEQKLNKTKALAILSSDALSSVAYGPEQILLVLVTVSAVAFWYTIPIGIGILILLLALILSYRQIIFAYPHGGGAYVVSKKNLGINPGLIAGGSLLVDYILTVAVSVSSGTDAITSAFPGLHPYNVVIACALVVLITILNLRGITESASILAYPVYLFVLALFHSDRGRLVQNRNRTGAPNPARANRHAGSRDLPVSAAAGFCFRELGAHRGGGHLQCDSELSRPGAEQCLQNLNGHGHAFGDPVRRHRLSRLLLWDRTE
ncbi:hypothetical protein ABIE48_006458 [Paenibacillus sp. OAE614]